MGPGCYRYVDQYGDHQQGNRQMIAQSQSKNKEKAQKPAQGCPAFPHGSGLAGCAPPSKQQIQTKCYQEGIQGIDLGDDRLRPEER